MGDGPIDQVRGGREEPRWFWSIQGVLGKPADMRDHGDALTLESAKAELEANWRKWLAWAKLGGDRLEVHAKMVCELMLNAPTRCFG